VRRRGTAQQRLRLGSIGYLCGCQRRLTKPDSNSNRDCHGNSYSNRNTYTNGNTYSNCNRNTDDYAGSDCETYPNAQAASHTSVEAIRRGFGAIS